MDYYQDYLDFKAAAKKSDGYYEEILGAMTPPQSKIKESVSGQQEQEVENLKKTNELFETLYILSLFIWLVMNGMLTVVIKFSFPGFVEKGVVCMAWLFYTYYCYYGFFKFRNAEKKHNKKR